MMTRGDRLLISLLILVGLFFLAWRSFGASSRTAEVEVTLKGRPVLTFPLLPTGEKEYLLDLQEGVAVLKVKEGAVRLLPVDDICPRHICSHIGWIRNSGESIVCLPNQLVIRITNSRGESVDAISR